MRMSDLALGSVRRGGGFGYSIHSHIISGDGSDFAIWLERLSHPIRVYKYLLMI